MPSRKLERKCGSLELTEHIRSICSQLEKKIRNLEKRKGKLETYKSEISEGKPLNEDQKIAVIKCDEVDHTLKFTKELLTQLTQAVEEVVKTMMRQTKFRNSMRLERDIVKAREILIVQDVLGGLGDEGARKDFLAGRNGALKLSDEQLENLDKLYKLITPGREDGDPSFEDQLNSTSSHLAELVNSRVKDVLGTTYKELMDLILEIHNNGYFQKNPIREVPELVELPKPVESCGNAEVVSVEPTTVSTAPVVEPCPVPVVHLATNVAPLMVTPSSSSPPSAPPPPMDTTVRPVCPPPRVVEDRTVFSTFTQSKPYSEILTSGQSAFNFLLDSQIELDASQIDPAVVAVHTTLPPSASISYPGAQRPEIIHYSMPPNMAKPMSTMTAHETNTSVAVHQASQFLQPSQITQHAPVANFGQTIPSQTFTNQSFVNLQTFAAALYGGQVPHPQLVQQQTQQLQQQVHNIQQQQQQQQQLVSTIIGATATITEPKKHLMNVNATTFQSLSFKQQQQQQQQQQQPPPPAVDQCPSASGISLAEEEKIPQRSDSIDATCEPRRADSPETSEIAIQENKDGESTRYKESDQYASYGSRVGYNNKNNNNSNNGGSGGVSGRGMNRNGFFGSNGRGRGSSNGYLGRGGRSMNNNYANGGRNTGSYQNNYRDYYQNSYSRENYEGNSSNGNYGNGHYRRREGGGSLHGSLRGGMSSRGGGSSAVAAGTNGVTSRGNYRSGYTKTSDPPSL